MTPNIPEAEILSGRRIESIEDARAAAFEIQQMGASAVVITGGHAAGNEIVDLLFDGHLFTELHTTRIATPNTHGTGCTFASAIAANLALGHLVLDAVVRDQDYVRGAIQHALAIGHGHGPLDHFWKTVRLKPTSYPTVARYVRRTLVRGCVRIRSCYRISADECPASAGPVVDGAALQTCRMPVYWCHGLATGDRGEPLQLDRSSRR